MEAVEVDGVLANKAIANNAKIDRPAIPACLNLPGVDSPVVKSLRSNCSVDRLLSVMACNNNSDCYKRLIANNDLFLRTGIGLCVNYACNDARTYLPAICYLILAFSC